MKSQDTYIAYLESLVISLMNARPDVLADIQITDPKAPVFMANYSASPYNVEEEIQRQRVARSHT